jgi:branched-chain amino acid transport system permease protein
MYKKLAEYITVGIVVLLLFFLFVTFLQVEKIDFRISYFFIFFVLLILFVKNEKTKGFLSKSFKENAGFLYLVIIIFLVFLPFPLRENPYLIHICIMIGLYSIMALGLNVYLGSFGMVNFCFGAYFGIGAYTSALLATNFHLSFWITLILAGIGGLLGGILVSLATLKNKGFYYVLVTFAFQQVFHLMVNNLEWTGGPDGVVKIPFPKIGSYSLGQPLNLFGVTLPFHANFYYLTLFLAILSILIIIRINTSKTALIWNAIRDDEIAANCHGINIFWRKVEVGAVGAFFGGMVGPLYGHYVGYISPEVFTWEVSAVLLSMIILGGINNISGVIVGVSILTILTEKFQLFSNYRTLVFGLIILFFLIFKPGGFIPERVRDYKGLIIGTKLSKEHL